MTAKRLILPLLLLLLCFAFSCKHNRLVIPQTIITHNTSVHALQTVQLSANSRFKGNDYITQEQQEETQKQAQADRELLLQISSDHNKLLLVCLVFTIFSSLLVYFLIRQRHKRERFMESYITETRIAKKVHDEIANEIFGTINYLATTNDIPEARKEKLIAKLDDIYLMTKNISRETNNIDTGYEFPEHLKMMLNSYSDNNVNVIIKGINDINWDAINAIKKIAAYRSLQEIMVNMKKHSQAGLVVLDFTVSNKKVKISYTDNGRGASQSELLLKNGIVNIEDRMISIDGNVTLETTPGKGFHITLTYPVQMPYV